ncbi:hypothetical protein MMH89_03210 [Candidatus Comchoanobacter bicostacola]|uniref:Uncharacterized protein n=1 Tax=Candidatus Comchoanobacter bicostacola TaxID=2919598 RepID=A0ABY5DIN6_9GAMM|nr:hypothetical protein [Candidatus Comchoanobacter bicostacola]UTC24231.1 hypothetical protein MMH89_03210 [Candidatus Comchoanobacter bicostacola]
MSIEQVKQVIETVHNVKEVSDATLSMKALSVANSLDNSAKAFYAGILALFLSVVLKSFLGLQLEEMLGAVLLGYASGKYILHKVLPRFIKSVKTDDGKSIASSSEFEKAVDAENELQNKGEQLASKISNTSKSILTLTSIIYFLSHSAGPLFTKLGPIFQAIAVFLPGLQFAAIAIFALTTVYIVVKRIQEYRADQRSKSEESEKATLNLESSNINRKEVTVSKNTLVGIVGLTLMNAALITLQVSFEVLGAKVVMPTASIILFGFIAAYTLFYALPKGMYTIRLNMQKIDVKDVKVNDGVENDLSLDPEHKEKSSLVEKLNVTAHTANKAIGIATLGMVIHHFVHMVSTLAFIETLALVATSYIAALSVLLIAVPRIVNRRNLSVFKKSIMFQNVKKVADTGLINEQVKTQSLKSVLSLTELCMHAKQLVTHRPDIVIAALLISLRGKQDKDGNDLAKSLEKTVIKHGFRDLEITVNKLDKATLQSIYNISQDESVRTSKLVGPYVQKYTATIDLKITQSLRRTKQVTKEGTPPVLEHNKGGPSI